MCRVHVIPDLPLTLRYSVFLYRLFFFFFNDTATTEIYTLSLHDALPISSFIASAVVFGVGFGTAYPVFVAYVMRDVDARSEEHTSELQSRLHLVCRLLLEKKKRVISFRDYAN